MLHEILSPSPLSQYLSTPYHPFPSYRERQQWNALPAEARDFFMDKANALQGKSWASLPAAYYLDFTRIGDRQQYETLYFQRRSDLFALLIGECIEGRGRFIDDIINGCWLICEESTWVVPAHNAHYQREGLPMALANKEAAVYIDLFSAETGALLAWVYYFLKEELDKVTPLVSRRIEMEMIERIITPFLTYEDYWWLGFAEDKPVNNWNPWINSNVLIAFLVFAPDVPTKAAGVEKAVRSLDRFLYFYHEDGGCDEGPSYFNVAGASLLDCIETLAGVIPEMARLYDNAKIKNIAEYITKVYIGRDYYVNFADAPVRTKASAIFLYRIGEKLGSENVMGFGYHLYTAAITAAAATTDAATADAAIAAAATTKAATAKAAATAGLYEVYNASGRTTFRALSDLFQPPLKHFPYKAPDMSWFEGIQVMTVRTQAQAQEQSQAHATGVGGLFVAAKGGHNDESHNHNDIGNFVLYYNDRPVIVDVGVGVYEKRTFSSERYDIWTMQSGYHNTPTINGFTQLPGRARQAEAVSFQTDGTVTTLCMDIHKAYPDEAQILRYTRRFVFQQEKGLEVIDRYALCQSPGALPQSPGALPLSPSLVINLMCCNRPEVCPEGLLLDADGPVVLGFVGCERDEFNIDIDEIPLTDPKLRLGWERESLYRLRLTLRTPKIEGETAFLITAGR